MHILITNDDGPPSPHSSPYVATLVSELKKSGHTVSVCLPHTQRSWIGKAHMIGQTVKPQYYLPSSQLHGPGSEGTAHNRPTTTSPSSATTSTFDADQEWVLVDGTPASCVQIGLHHFFAERGPVDLVVSGPNYGRNTTAVFALSSGTLGGALEAAVCGKKAIALSFAFFSRNHDPDIIEGASRHGVRVIERLYNDWPADGSVDLYSVNVPLVEGVGDHKTLWTDVLQNYWREGSCFQEVEGTGDEEVEEERIREGVEGEVIGDSGGAKKPEDELDAARHRPRHFKWAPRFAEVYKSVDEAPPGNDGWAVKEGCTSVTPLKANFWHAAEHLHQKELVLLPLEKENEKSCPAEQHQHELPLRPGNTEESAVATNNKPASPHFFYALVDYQDDYVQPLILHALETLVPEDACKLLTTTNNNGDNAASSLSNGEPVSLASLLPDPSARILQITPYESIDFEHAVMHPSTTLINSYMIRKALIRKHYLSATVETWVAKNPGSALQRGVKRSEHFEVDYAEFLDDSLVEAFDLRESMERNAQGEDADGDDKPAQDREWWILKPGMSDRGQGIRLFSTTEELQGIFDAWEAERPDSDDEVEEDDDGGGGGDYIKTSHLRHFIVQPYIHPPLLLRGDGRKFHIRTYVLSVGCLGVYVYSDMLALFAAKQYVAPWEPLGDDLDVHLTNTCIQQQQQQQQQKATTTDSALNPPLPYSVVSRLRDLVTSGALPATTAASVTAQIRDLTGDLFEAAARGMMVHFQPLPNAFEAYGLDFLVDAEGRAWLLEVNAFPDFKQTGEGAEGELREVVAGFWREAVGVAVGRFFGVGVEGDSNAGTGAGHEDRGWEWEGVGRMELVREVDLGRR